MGSFEERICQLTEDHESGASDLMRQASAILAEAVEAGVDLVSLADRLVRAQPSMAPMWNLAGQALVRDSGEFARYVERLNRAPDAVARLAQHLFSTDEHSPLRLVTTSFSATVVRTLERIAAARAVEVSCAESRPALEGRRLAERLASEQMRVLFYSDAGIGEAVTGADAVLVGADAITPDWWLNKVGTRMLAATAAQQGVPVYVCATRDKFLPAAVGARLLIRDESPDEIWPSPPPGVTVRNRYFERIPLDLIAAVISDLGVLGTGMVPDACASPHEAVLLRLGTDGQSDL